MPGNHCQPMVHPWSDPGSTSVQRALSPPSPLLSPVQRLPRSSKASSCGLRSPRAYTSKPLPSGSHRNTAPVSGSATATPPGARTDAPRSAMLKYTRPSGPIVSPCRSCPPYATWTPKPLRSGRPFSMGVGSAPGARHFHTSGMQAIQTSSPDTITPAATPLVIPSNPSTNTSERSARPSPSESQTKRSRSDSTVRSRASTMPSPLKSRSPPRPPRVAAARKAAFVASCPDRKRARSSTDRRARSSSTQSLKLRMSNTLVRRRPVSTT